MKELELERRLQLHHRLHVQHEVMRVIAEETSIEKAMPRLLTTICKEMGWGGGVYWQVHAKMNLLYAHSYGGTASAPIEQFFQECREVRARLGDGHLGQVWQTRTPVFVSEVLEDQRYARIPLSEKYGFQGAVLFPVACANQVHGVFEFLTQHAQQSDAELAQTLSTMGFQIGQFMERLLQEKELFRRKEWLAKTLESIGDAVIATDVRGRIEFMNPIAEQLTGWHKGEAEGRELHDVFSIQHPSSAAGLSSTVSSSPPAAHSPLPSTFTRFANASSMKKRDGTEIYVEDSVAPILNESGELLGTVVVFRDVTESRRHEEYRKCLSDAGTALSSSLDYQQTLAAVAHLAVPHFADWCAIDILAEDGALELLSAAHANADKVKHVKELRTRFPPDPNLTRGIWSVLRSGQPEFFADFSDDALRSATRSQEHYELVKKMGLRSLIIVPLTARNRTLGTVTFARSESVPRYDELDFGFAKELAMRMALAVDNARLFSESQKAIGIRDEFLSIASHELKTPLTPLQIQLYTLSRKLSENVPDENSQRWLEKRLTMISRQGARLGRLVDELLDVSRLLGKRLELNLEEVCLSECVRHVAGAFEEQGEIARSGCDVTLELEESVKGEWDKLRLEQIITNLLSNALKYAAGSKVLITTSVYQDKATLVVADQGIGIAPEHHEQIFGRFERVVTHRNLGGLGLGLYIVRQLVKALGGEIQVSSAPRKGATFTVQLPLKHKEISAFGTNPGMQIQA